MTTVEQLGARRRARDAAAASPASLAASVRTDYDRWLSHVAGAAGCSHPIRLSGMVHHVEASTGRITREATTSEMPDGVIYTACGNRRANVCPGCAETYRADTYQLVTAGLIGGKGIPVSVAGHPCVFLTVTAPSFGPVHAHRTDTKGRTLPCRPRRAGGDCEHGAELACWDRHGEDDPILGRPLCLDCYDHPHQAVWNLHAGELWRRTTITARRALRRLEHRYDVHLRLSYTKVAEFQARGAVHLPRPGPPRRRDPLEADAIPAPDSRVTAGHLALLLGEAVADTRFTTDTHPARPQGWDIAWGEQTDPRPVRLSALDLDDTGEISTAAVAGYLAKYATKATELARARLRPTHAGHHPGLRASRHAPRPPGRHLLAPRHPSGDRRPPRGFGPRAVGRDVGPAPEVGAHARLRRALLHPQPALLHDHARPAPGPTRLAPPARHDRAPRSTTSTTSPMRTPPRSSSPPSPSPGSAGTPAPTPCSRTPPPPTPASDAASPAKN